MKPSILISGTIEAETTATIHVPHGAVHTIFANGLDGTEAVAVSLLAADVDEGDAAAGDWLALLVAGAAVQLDVDTPSRLLEGPGVYQLSIAASAGAIKVGVY